MTFDLSEDDLEQIEGWYNSAAGESATTDGTATENARLKALLDKFGFEYHCMDEERLKNDMIDLAIRAREIAEFLNLPEADCVARLERGFHAAHADVAADFRRTGAITDAGLLDWYRTTEAYIWELSAYHLDSGFNYSGMCGGIAEHLKASGASLVLCLGDGIGDLTLALRQAGFDAVYHDLHGSQTARFAQFRNTRHTDRFVSFLTTGWEPINADPVFDAIVSLDFLEHVTDVPAWTRAVYDALKPGGLFCFQNAFNCGSGDSGSIPCHLTVNDKYETEWTPLLASLGFVMESGNWARKPA